MAETNELLARARALGEGLAAHPLVKSYHEAQAALRADGDAQQLLRDYQTQLARIRQLEAEGKPIEVADKHKLRNFEQQMASRESLKRLMRVQTDYIAFMNQINAAIDGPIAELATPEPAA